MLDFVQNNSFLLVSMTLNAMLALSLYLPLMAGQLSLASPGFYAVGGYIAAVMSTKVFPPTAQGDLFPFAYLLIEMVIAAVVCGVLGLLIGLPALRLRGIYLALATIAFVEIVRVLSLNLDITGKAIGIFGIPQPFLGYPAYLPLAVFMLIVTALFVWRLERIRIGRAFSALREDELAAAAMGINPTYYKVLAFVMGAILAGMVGVLSAHVLNTWNARQGTFDISVLVLAYVIIGGSRTFLGSIVGALILTALPEALRAASKVELLPSGVALFLDQGRLIIYGLLLAVATIFFPQGLLTPDLLRRMTNALRRTVPSASSSTETPPQ